MRRNYNIINKGVARRLAVGCLMLFALAGNLMAQHPGPHVIKYNDTIGTNPLSITYHYLTHVFDQNTGKWVLQDDTNFSPACIWISDQTFTSGGTNKNYYFYDDENHPKFLAAPSFTAGGEVIISNASPTATDLNNPEFQYYFYRWDNGLGRGVQYFGVTEETCLHEWDDRYNECWEVYWVALDETDNNTWKLSEEHYGLEDTHNTVEPEPRGGRYSWVDVSVHDQDTITTFGGLADLTGFEMEYNSSPITSHPVSPSITTPYRYSFTPEYTTYIVHESDDDQITHHYYGGVDHGTTPPESQNGTGNNPTYQWTLSGPGAAYLSFASDSNELESTSGAPTVYYRTENTTGDKTATLTLTVTYSDGSKQHSTAAITVKTPCQNPGLAGSPVVTYVDVTVSWYPTASSYIVYWQKTGEYSWHSANVGNVTSYAITGLDFESTYNYKVQATSCEMAFPEATGTFTTLDEPEGTLVFGAIFGGGRMADVMGKTEVVVINCDSIGAIYGGNDITGIVHDDAGSRITLGVKANDPYEYDTLGTTNAEYVIKIGSVYGGGNGYYSYGSTTFVPVSQPTKAIGGGASIYALSKDGEWTDIVWTNPSATVDSVVNIPSITKTEIMVTDNYIKTDSIFGGAKNAYLTATTGNGSDITINGGTHLAVFGGNNVGGGQGAAKQHIVVNKTKINLVPNIVNTAKTGYGRSFGIRYLFGGGNKVDASNTEVVINGGQLDTIFAGGNAADVTDGAKITMSCALGEHTANSYIYGNTYTKAINNDQYTTGTIGNKTIDTVNYAFDGFSGVYNVRTLFGGNNRAAMNNVVPDVILTSGSVGTVYGGGNAGDMNYQQTGGLIPFTNDNNLNDLEFDYSTHVVLNSNAILVDYLYGGCQMSDVLYSTFVELKEGHVGTVYGGCNISGDVGSTQVDPDAPYIPQSLDDQAVYGSTYVKAGYADGRENKKVVVYKNLYGGSNGYYNCSTDGITYNADSNFDDPTGKYAGLTIPTHNETHAVISDGARIRGDVYAGGNMACVGFDDGQGTYDNRDYPELVGMASIRMDGGRVEKNVYGGCNMSDIYGSNEVRVSGGYIGMALYGGNDRSGQVAEKTNRFLPDEYLHASDNLTSLSDLGVKTYVGVKGSPRIGTVYGGGNGDYVPGEDDVTYCYENFAPIQSYTFVDIHIDGGTNGGHIGTVYGGGNGVTVRHGVTVFINNDEPNGNYDYDNIDTIFGGNNKGHLDVVADILLLHGHVGTVYGGCNMGAMEANGVNTDTIGGYENIGSYVRLLEEYVVGNHVEPVTAQVSKAIYGGCRMNGVTNNSLVLVEGGDFSGVNIFGGSDISGHVGGWSRVAVTGRSVNGNYVSKVGNVYGGGNGNYYYECADGVCSVYLDADHTQQIVSGINGAPTCAHSGVDLWGGQVGVDATNKGSVFGGGLGQMTSTQGNVIVNVGDGSTQYANETPLIYGNVYGGSAYGNVNSNANNTTTVNFLNGTLHGYLFGGGLGQQPTSQNSNDGIEAKVYGKVYVKIGDEDQTDQNCFIDLRDGDVFGCNNLYGSPQSDVEVHVWKTAHTATDSATYVGTAPNTLTYAIHQVFGGGHQANYAPENGSTTSTKKALVYVHGCSNTIWRVFAGGDAAAAVGVTDTIDGGRMDYVFGGGNGEATAANIGAGGTHTVVTGGVINHLFGGSNTSGDIAGDIYTEVSGDNEGCQENIKEFFGGNNLANLALAEGKSIYSIIKCGAIITEAAYGGCNEANITGDVTFDVRGGTIANVFGGSKGDLSTLGNGHENKAADITGNVTLNLEGGSITNAFGGSNYNGSITGNITVNVIDFELDECGLSLTDVYGAGNLTPYTPSNNAKPVVNVMHIAQTGGITGNVFGGAKGGNIGNTNYPATVTASPIVNIGYVDAMEDYLNAIAGAEALDPNDFTAKVSGNVYGGGELSPVAGSTTVNVNNGTVVHKVFGGGKQAGVNIVMEGGNPVDNTGNAEVYIKDGNIGTDGNPTTGAGKGVYGGCDQSGAIEGYTRVELTGGTLGTANSKAGVFGGGFGQNTEVKGDVTVNFGNDSDEENTNLILYGDLYGGSALGKVNTYDMNTPGTNTNTYVNVRNGTITGIGSIENNTFEYGGVYGGGLGQRAGTGTSDILADVYGKVYVKIGDVLGDHFTGKASLKYCDVYGCNNQNGSPQSDVYVDVYQTIYPENDSVQVEGGDYAIHQVFGGGNHANYTITGKDTHVVIHGCYNTIDRVFGGGNAADVYGVILRIEGGRMFNVFGGGNGELGNDYAAGVGAGGVAIHLGGGHITSLYNGSNMAGDIMGEISLDNFEGDCGPTIVVDHYMGSNQADVYGVVSEIIYCESDPEKLMKFVNLYCGCNKAQIYGNINLTIEGGIFENVYGGSKGSLEGDGYSSNIQDDPATQNEVEGHINLTILGGSIGNLYGGCDLNGNVTGRISITVHSADNACGLFVGNIYGAGNLTNYAPTNINNNLGSNYAYSPEIKILKATVGGYCNDLPIVPTEQDPRPKFYEGNVFGGGNHGNVTGSPRVIVGDGIVNNSGIATTPVTIKGSVYGGGNEGDVTGDPKVIVVPTTHTFTATIDKPTGDDRSVIHTTNSVGTEVSDTQIGENLDVKLKAIPNIYGYKFNGWSIEEGTGNGGFISNPNATSTVFTMGTQNANIKATFVQTTTHTFTYTFEPTEPEGGAVRVYDGFGELVNSGSSISESAELSIVAIPHALGYRFDRWVVTGNGQVADDHASTTTFIMGTGDVVTLKAIFVESVTRLFTYTPGENGSFTVKDRLGTTVPSNSNVSIGAVLNVEATPDEGYRFKKWIVTGNGASVDSSTAASTTFTMGTSASTLTAEFELIPQP